MNLLLPNKIPASASKSLKFKYRQTTVISSLDFLLSLFFLLLLFVFPLHLEAAEGEHCPQWVGDEIQFCVQPVAEFARNLNQQQTEHENAQNQQQTALGSEIGSALQWPTKMGGEVFRVLCRLINDFELCVDGYRDKCRRHITIDLIEASYGFLCNEGFQIFMASAECLMELDQQPSVKSCHDRTLLEIEEANNEQNEKPQTKLDRMCNALNYFAECVRPSIRRNCGVEAWRVIFRVLKDTSKTLMPNCGFHEYPEELESGEKESKRPPATISSNEPKSRDYDSEEFGQHPFGRKQSSTVKPTMGEWERWEEEGNGNEEDGDGIGVNIETDSSHQIHYGSHLLGQQNGVQKINSKATNSTKLLLFSTFVFLILFLF